ncbi:MAG: hypothetical protein JSS49_30080 [Planctomycetes bacterium]|nr:hypothetical protein [Planctomycetota bacterium]
MTDRVTTRREEIDGLDSFVTIMSEIGSAHHRMDYADVLTGFLPKVQESHQSNFDGRHSPDGSAWPALSKTTVAKKGHDVPLVEFLRLKPSVLELAHPDHVGGVSSRGFLFGTSVEYGFFNNFGTAKIPQREFIGLPVPLVDDLAGVVADHEVDGLKLR